MCYIIRMEGVNELNERIKKIRKYLDLTQQEFADKLKIKRNTVATYETGKSNPSDAAVALICKTFDVNEPWLRTGEGEMFAPVAQDQTIFNFVEHTLQYPEENFKRRFISALPQLDEAEWDALEKIFSLVAKQP